MEQGAQVAEQHPMFYTIVDVSVNAGDVYDLFLKEWHDPPVARLPAERSVLPVASAGGLVCFRDMVPHNLNFYVGDPLTASFRSLPPRPVKDGWSRVAVGMTLNGSSTDSGYKIMWVGRDGEYEVYDSSTNSWGRPGGMPPAPLSLNCWSRPVSDGSTLNFLCSEPEGIVSYDMRTGFWKQSLIRAPLPLTDQALVECNGRIMLVGLVTENAAARVCICQLQKEAGVWEEVCRGAKDFYWGETDRMYCLGNKGVIVLSLRNRLDTYNVAKEEWSSVQLRGGSRRWITNGITFHPSPNARD